MSLLTLAVLLLAISRLSVSGGVGTMTWCLCKEGNEAALQKALDYACGAGGDCTQLRQGGACYQPNTLRAHCSYAVNSYYLKKHPSGATCNFSGAATISTTDPSANGCAYSASSSSGTTTTPVTTPSSTSTVTPTSGTITSPYSSSTSTTTGGGFSIGLAPTSTNTADYSHAGTLHIGATATLSIFLFIGLLVLHPIFLN